MDNPDGFKDYLLIREVQPRNRAPSNGWCSYHQGHSEPCAADQWVQGDAHSRFWRSILCYKTQICSQAGLISEKACTKCTDCAAPSRHVGRLL